MLLLNYLVDRYLVFPRTNQSSVEDRRILGARMVKGGQFVLNEFLPDPVTISNKNNKLIVTGEPDEICLVNLSNPKDKAICD
jgi:hypothetical protein